MAHRRVTSAILAAAISIATATASGALDNIYKTDNTPWNCYSGTMNAGHYCQTDNSGVSVYIAPTVAGVAKTHIKSALAKYDATDLTVTYTDNPIFEGASETDVVIQIVALPVDVLGVAYCESVVTGSTLRCDQHFIRFTSSPSIDVYVACHEFGHTMGLTHGREASPRTANDNAALGCMRTPYDGTTSSALGTQNATMLNQTY